MAFDNFELFAAKFAEHSPLWDEGKTSGDCFQRAAYFMLANNDKEPQPTLVHAQVRESTTGEWIDHAWCEIPAEATYEDGSEGPIVIVVDGTQPDPNARFIPREIHVEKVVRRDRREFTFEQMVEMARRFAHDGPWR